MHGTTVLKDGQKLEDICGTSQQLFLKVIEIDGLLGGSARRSEAGEILDAKAAESRLTKKRHWKRKNE